MEPFQILGKKYIDDEDTLISSFKLFRIRNGLTYSYAYGEYSESWEYRIPSDVNMYARDHPNVSNKWHQDGAKAVILWTNMYPTEILLPDKTIVTGEPYDVILFDNMAVEHRTPIDYQRLVLSNPNNEPGRLFIRGSIWHHYPTDDDIKEWKAQLD